MRPQVFGTVYSPVIVVLHAARGESFENRRVQDRGVLNVAKSLGPFEPPPKPSGFPLVVLRTKRIRMQLQVPFVYRDAEGAWCLAVGKIFGRMHHPSQRDVGKAGLVLRIATADVGMVSCKPDLLQPVRILVGTFRTLVVRAARRKADVRYGLSAKGDISRP